MSWIKPNKNWDQKNPFVFINYHHFWMFVAVAGGHHQLYLLLQALTRILQLRTHFRVVS